MSLFGGSDDGLTVELHGIDDAAEILRSIVPRLRKRAVKNALMVGGRLIRDIAKANRKADSAASMNTGNPVTQFRRHGVVAAAIAVRTSMIAVRAGDVGVFINVRPLKVGDRSGHNPDDPFYWRWIEFGTKHMAARPFLTPAALHLEEALTVIEEKLGDEIAKLEVNGKDPL